MKFKPCIDIHNGIVKQIVGSSLTENESDIPMENFTASFSSGYYAAQYQKDQLQGGHVIMLGPNCENAAKEALQAYPYGLQIGGGITIDNALLYLDQYHASHVIVTSYVFTEGSIDFVRLEALSNLVGKQRLVVDLSCRKKKQPSIDNTTTTDDVDDDTTQRYYVVTNKWTKYTDFEITFDNLDVLSKYCSEFLVHGVDVEGKRAGIEESLVTFLGTYAQLSGITITYAGGIRSIEDLELVKRLGNNKVDCTVGSALDMFGGDLEYEQVLSWHYNHNNTIV